MIKPFQISNSIIKAMTFHKLLWPWSVTASGVEALCASLAQWAQLLVTLPGQQLYLFWLLLWALEITAAGLRAGDTWIILPSRDLRKGTCEFMPSLGYIARPISNQDKNEHNAAACESLSHSIMRTEFSFFSPHTLHISTYPLPILKIKPEAQSVWWVHSLPLIWEFLGQA